MGVKEEAIKRFGTDILTKPFGSMMHTDTGEEQFMNILDRILSSGEKFQHCIEIGTCCGLSAVMLAKYFEKITTFDIQDNPIRHKVWECFSVDGRIDSYIVTNAQAVREVVSKLDFDVAYIDGGHLYADVVFDIETVKKCGRILFHDYDLYSKDHVMKAVHELLCSQPFDRFIANPPFAYWEAVK